MSHDYLPHAVNSDYLPYLKTLRRIPDDIVLAIASREIDVNNRDTCICGWALRENIARSLDKAADDVENPSWSTSVACADAFGGYVDEWSDVFLGVMDTPTVSLIEAAFVERVLEAVG